VLASASAIYLVTNAPKSYIFKTNSLIIALSIDVLEADQSIPLTFVPSAIIFCDFAPIRAPHPPFAV
jgi:hypothetical protein